MPSRSLRRRVHRLNASSLVAVLVPLLGVVIAAAVFHAHRNATPLRSTISGGSSVTLYLDGNYGAEFAGEMLAAKHGHFASGDVDVVLNLVGRGEDIASIVSRNRAIGVTSGQNFLLARWRGERIVAFGASFLDTPTAIYTLEKSGLRTPKDLIGKRLSYQTGGDDVIVFDAMMVQLGLPRGQIRHVPTDDGFAALVKGEVDAVIAKTGREPLPSNIDPARYTIIKPKDYGIHIPGLVYFSSSDLAASSPSVIGAVLRGAILGWLDVYADPNKSAEAIAQFDPQFLTAQRVRRDLAQQRDLVRPAGTRIADYDESRWKTLRDILLFAKLGEETVGLPLAVSYDFVRDVYRRPFMLGQATAHTPGRDGSKTSR